MEGKPVLKKMSVAEMDRYFRKISMDLNQELTDPTAHMIFSTKYHQSKKHNQIEQTPMLHHGGRLLSAQRISYFMYHGIDVKKKSHLFLKCGETNCVNPTHLVYLATEEERKEFINK